MRRTLLAALTATLAFGLTAWPSLAHGTHAGHHHVEDEAAQQIQKGYFEDQQVKDRPLSDWAGVWQSVYPYLQDGTLAPVMADKASHGTQSAQDYTAYYETGYKTETDGIEITAEGAVIFRTRDGSSLSGRYVSDGHEILTYAKGNRGVRFIFKKASGDAAAPAFIQFSDHRIAPSVSDHFHLYWGEDRAALLAEVTHWPTYYPAALSGAEIVAEMMAH